MRTILDNMTMRMTKQVIHQIFRICSLAMVHCPLYSQYTINDIMIWTLNQQRPWSDSYSSTSNPNKNHLPRASFSAHVFFWRLAVPVRAKTLSSVSATLLRYSSSRSFNSANRCRPAVLCSRDLMMRALQDSE